MPIPTALMLLVIQASTAVSQQTTAELVDMTASAVVEITVATTDGGKVGSGFLVESDGVILTNHHVISGGTSAAVRLPSGDVFNEVQILAEDERRDIAILQIAGFGLPTLPLGNSDSVPVGSDILAIGSPLGLENTVSTGIVSAYRQYEGYRLMQISAPISHGSSGGPILDRAGIVVGIAVSGIEEGQNLNFAVPVNYARGLLASVGSAPAERLAKLSNLGSPSQFSSLESVNMSLPAVTSFRDYAYESEEDRGNGYKVKYKNYHRRISAAGDTLDLVEFTGEEVTEYKSGSFASSQKIGNAQIRSLSAHPDLRPLEYYENRTWWDGSRWKSGSRELHFEEGVARGFTIEDGVRTEHNIPIPPGTRMQSLALTIGSVMADSILGRTIAVTIFNPSALTVTEVFVGFKGRTKMNEAGREFLVVGTELRGGAYRAEYYYSTDVAPYPVRWEYSGGKGKIKKLL